MIFQVTMEHKTAHNRFGILGRFRAIVKARTTKSAIAQAERLYPDAKGIAATIYDTAYAYDDATV